MQDFFQAIPKAELHIHIEGTLEPELMFKIAQRNRVALKYKTVAEAESAYHFQDLQSFLDIYYQSAAVLLQEEDFYDLTLAYLRKAKQQNILHTEIFFDPQTHTQRGIPFATVVQGIHRALVDGKQQFGISSHLILCFLRDLSEEAALETLKQALPFKEWIIAVGLDSAEAGNPPSKFKKVYDMAHQEGFLAVAHAGEEGGPAYIEEALDILKVARIDHGVRCMEDPQLVARLVKEKVPLTICPLSNIKLHVFEGMQYHPIKKMLAAGLQATINSDDPAFFGGYVAENMRATQAALHLTKQDFYQLEKNAFTGSFLQPAEKQKLLAQLDEFIATANLIDPQK